MSVTDTEMLEFVQAEYIDLVAFEMPTGAGDADVGWKCLQHHEGEDKPREIGVSHHDDPRAAIRNAMQVLGYEPKPPANDEDWMTLCAEVTKALADLSFECFGGIGTTRPSVETYNRTFAVLDAARKTIAAAVVSLPREAAAGVRGVSPTADPQRNGDTK